MPYLAELGITDCYASPYLKAAPGSNHGYDITDPTQLNPEIGTDRRPRGMARRPQATWPRAGPRRRAQPHGDHRQPEPLVERRAARTGRPPLRPILRHRLVGPDPARKPGSRTAAIPGRSLRRGAREGRASASSGRGARSTSSTTIIGSRWTPRAIATSSSRPCSPSSRSLGAEHEAVLEFQSILATIEACPAIPKPRLIAIAERQREKEIVKRRLSELRPTIIPRSQPASRLPSPR